jgi:ornithine--oxo-acid transaminase
MAISSSEHMALSEQWAAHNYHPLPVVVAHAEGTWVTDVNGKRYIDLLAGYSALNFGHRHPTLLSAAAGQLGRVTLTARAFHHDQFGPFCKELAELTGTEMVLPMNSGAEAVESAVKIARKWAYEVKGVQPGRAEIVVAGSNFHGRTTTIISFSTDESARQGFGPFTPGFVAVKFGDVEALSAAVNENTAAVLLEPIQGEGGIIVPPQGYLTEVRRICDDNSVLMIADEVQSGLARTGKLLACDREGVRADLYTLGKALGGGILPLSAVVGRRDVLGVLRPGDHGSTFGGNPLACAVGRAVVELLSTGEFQERAEQLGAHLQARTREMVGNGLADARVVGLWGGLDLEPAAPSTRAVSEALLERGVLHKEITSNTLRVAPPLTITQEELDIALDAIAEVVRHR